ncbi:5-oxoprolinase subunit PxpB [Leifsonia sp. AG29]|uniref:5-oxoprolinase subunit PxpB n=1 Tax=Leifsonia sp. AG29 TaxID=2598860 RepID=UPI00131CF77D|nr:5-oxoprolinase subunit PxpB [Leifsonia sp. AG29]
MTGRVVRYGDSALLVEFEGLDDVLSAYRALSRTRPAGVVDLVPAARTIAVTVDPRFLSLARVEAWVERTPPEDAASGSSRVIELPVRYDGPDLGEVADLLRVEPEEVIARHTGSVWRVAFGGFAPGFGYLVTDHDRLRVPRRATPRTSVPAGAVGLAGEFSGVYPRSSPGGWQLIGRTDAVLWDPEAENPALLVPGDEVRFVEVR